MSAIPFRPLEEMALKETIPVPVSLVGKVPDSCAGG